MKSEKTYLQYQQTESAKSKHWSRREAVQAAIDAGASELSAPNPDREQLFTATEALRRAFVGPENEHLSYYAKRAEISTRALARVAEGGRERWALEDAYQSLVNIAEFESLISNVTNHSMGTGFELPLGRIWSSFEMEYPDELQLVTRGSGWPKTLFTGKTGQGKSATLDSAVADRYAAGMKVVDLLDTDEFESAVYDIPQKQRTLREARGDLGLPADYHEVDGLEKPNLEILVPLTSETEEMRVPVDSDGSTVILPFVIPTDDLDQATLVTFLSALVSKQQETSIRTAYDEVSDEPGWTLRDLAEQVIQRDDLDDKYQRRVVRLLENLQGKGFLRTADHEYALDWERIFNDTETITAFSVAPLEESVDQMMVMSYLVRGLYDARTNLTELPPCAAVARELHEIVPHRNETAADARAEALQEAIAHNLSYILRKNRHERLEILGDTQDLMDLKKGVRMRFSRFVLFNLPERSVKSAFSIAGVSDWKTCYESLGPETGVGAVVGDTEATSRYGRGFVTPVQFAPSPIHHFDVDSHDTGLEARVNLLGEDWETKTWQASADDGLSFDAAEVLGGDRNQYQHFAEVCIEDSGEEPVRAAKIIDAYENFCDEFGYDAVDRSSFGQLFPNRTEGYDYETDRTGGVSRYVGIRLTAEGQNYLKPAGADDSQAAQSQAD